MSRLILIGVGGHAKVLAEACRAGNLQIMGYITDTPVPGGTLAFPRLGTDDELLSRSPQGVALINGVGSVGSARRRREIFEKFHTAGFAFASVVHPSAVVAAGVEIGEGAQIMAGVVIQPGVRIGCNSVINTGAIVDHDCSIGAHAHVAPGARLAGDVVVGDEAHVGAGATVIQGIRIHDRALVAAGAVVVDDVAAGVTVMGCPARPKLSGKSHARH